VARLLAEPDRAGERDAAEMQRRLVAHVVDERCQQPEQRFAEVRGEPLDLVDVPRALTRHPPAHLLVGHFNGGLERRQPLPLGNRMPVEDGEDRLRDGQSGLAGTGILIHVLDSSAGPGGRETVGECTASMAARTRNRLPASVLYQQCNDKKRPNT
jgi:hypothetical protein